MALVAGIAIALQIQIQIGDVDRRAPTVVRDSTPPAMIARNAPTRIAVTAEHLATAFRTAATREAFLRARRARSAQDSAIRAYDVSAYTRTSVWAAITKLGRERLAFRHEATARVRWQRGTGTWIDVTGARLAMPLLSRADEIRLLKGELGLLGEISPVPYLPGHEALWISDRVIAEVNDRAVVHPLAVGSEAYYTFELGDSLSMKIGDGAGRTIWIRELRVRPREPKWNVLVGSMWFTVDSDQLVRAIVRLAVPLEFSFDMDPEMAREVPSWAKMIVNPLVASMSLLSIEYGLHEGRFWLPRTRVAEGEAKAMFVRAPVKIEQSFRYASVNGPDTLPTIRIVPPVFTARMPVGLDTTQRRRWMDSVNVALRRRMDSLGIRINDNGLFLDSLNRGLVPLTRYRCVNRDPDDTFVQFRGFSAVTGATAIRKPCDIAAVMNSPTLPPSLFEAGEELLKTTDVDALARSALGMNAQPPFAWTLPNLHYGIRFTRFNRVEGLSTGLRLDQQLGRGFSSSLTTRYAVAPRDFDVDLGLSRSNLSSAVSLGGYSHLTAANDWGDPLSVGSSAAALILGHDDGFFFRADGGDVRLTRERGGGAQQEWRLFAERQRTVPQNVHRGGFGPNLTADEGWFVGTSARFVGTVGLDPARLRAFTDLRLEAARGDSAYGRAALDLTLAQGVTHGFGVGLTLSGGTSIGALPRQRWWQIGGPRTVRGQSADTATAGTAYWFTRAELAGPSWFTRPTLFGDVGWVGKREAIRSVGRPMSGVGLGLSTLDGLLRIDLVRGVFPIARWRFDALLEAPF